MKKKLVISLVSVDGGEFPNIALMKIAAFHKSKGDNVEFHSPLFSKPDLCYSNKLFDFSNDYEYYPDCETIKGGTGVDVKSKLLNNIDSINQLDYNIYPNCKYSIQRFSTGCIRKCGFCIVNEKEGKIKPDKIYNLNPIGKHIEIMDNNFFANPEWRGAIKYLKSVNQPVNFHGVDVRIIDKEQCDAIKSLRHIKQIKIAWDDPNIKVDLKIKKMVKHIKPYRIMCYVLIGYDSTPEQDLYRIEKLRELKVDPFVMPYIKSDSYQKKFARWVNHKAIFNTVDFKDYR